MSVANKSIKSVPPEPKENKNISNFQNDQLKQQLQQPQQTINVFQDEEQQNQNKYLILRKVFENDIVQVIITLLTLYALFADDIRVLTTNKSADDAFDAITIICLIVFFVEIIFSILTKPDYTFSFFFWLDLISTISLILDIQMISTLLFAQNSASNAVQLARAGRASRVGTKAGRVVRLVRLIRIVKLYKAASNKQEKLSKEQKIMKEIEEKKKLKLNSEKKDSIQDKDLKINMNSDRDGGLQLQASQINQNNLVSRNRLSVNQDQIENPNQVDEKEVDEEDEEKEFKESKVSKKLSDLTTKRVIIIVLLLLLIMPLFNADYYFDPPASMDYSVRMFKNFFIDQRNFTQQDIKSMFIKIKDYHLRLDNPVCQFKTPISYMQEYNYVSDDYELLRADEITASSEEFRDEDLLLYKASHYPDVDEYNKLVTQKLQYGSIYIQAMINNRNTAMITAGMNLGRTLFVCLVLTLGALMFSKDANDLALRPIERMIDKVTQIAKNPQSAKEQKLLHETGEYETTIIENAIIKIGTLLALGFGDAGSEIIGSNMANPGDVDPMIPGKKKTAIYGFCDIRNFTDATEQLQEDVMLFVNNIGGIVHTMVDRFQGSANKNIGDAFLLVWKLQEDKYEITKDNKIIYKDKRYTEIICEYAAFSFMKVQAKINRVPKILEYRKDKRLLERMKNYRVKMGLGLHIGWSIEGAIGSEYKIDASYLSPNVTMASRLEGSTKAFGVPLLISSDLYTQFSPKFQKYVRHVDQVMMKGTYAPMGLYTIDMYSELPASKNPESKYQTLQIKMDYDKVKKLILKEQLEKKTFDAETYIQTNKDIVLLMQKWNQKFQDMFSAAFDCYISGKWADARTKFNECLQVQADDGPSKALLDFMGEHNFQTPSDWNGWRHFAE